VKSPPEPRCGVTFSVATMCPSAAEVVGVRVCAASSWVSPSLAVPSYPTEAAPAEVAVMAM
jgi:hypothetical protein